MLNHKPQVGAPALIITSTSESLSIFLEGIDQSGSLDAYYSELNKQDRHAFKKVMRLAHSMTDHLNGMTPLTYEDEILDRLGLDDKH